MWLKDSFDVKNPTDRLLAAQIILKSADIGNVAREWEPALQWSNLISEEFFIQVCEQRKNGIHHIILVGWTHYLSIGDKR